MDDNKQTIWVGMGCRQYCMLCAAKNSVWCYNDDTVFKVLHEQQHGEQELKKYRLTVE